MVMQTLAHRGWLLFACIFLNTGGWASHSSGTAVRSKELPVQNMARDQLAIFNLLLVKLHL